MAEKDMTEKTLEALNDVFADIVNGAASHGANQQRGAGEAQRLRL